MKKVLFVGAHTDDELCAAGTLSKFLHLSCEIFIMPFSFCEESTEQLGYPKDILHKEFFESMQILEIKLNNVFTGSIPVRNFPQHRQAILDKMINIKKMVNPDIIIVPSLKDKHQDHAVIAQEAVRAFPFCTILGFETLRSPLASRHKCYVKLNSENVSQKMACIDCYKSQKVRKGMNRDRAMSALKFRGLQAGCNYAEVFEVINLHL